MRKSAVKEARSPCGATGIWVLGARLTWQYFGPACLGVATAGIVRLGGGWATQNDAIFAVLVGVILLGRWMEMRSGTAMTADGKPAKSSKIRRFASVLMSMALCIWVTANILGNHALTTSG